MYRKHRRENVNSNFKEKSIAARAEENDCLAGMVFSPQSEHLNPVIVPIGNDNSSIPRHSQSLNPLEFAQRIAPRAKRPDPTIITTSKHLHPVIPRVPHNQVLVLIHRQSARILELSIAGALAANHRDDLGTVPGVENRDPVVA